MKYKLYIICTFIAVSSVLYAPGSAQKKRKIERLQAELEQLRQQSSKENVKDSERVTMEVLDQLKQNRAILQQQYAMLQQKDVMLQQKELEITSLRDIIKRMAESNRTV